MPSHRLALGFILATVCIDGIGIGLIFPVMPELLAELSGGNMGAAAFWGGILATAYAAMQFLCGPMVGGLSDRFGRRPVLLSALAVMAADYLLLAMVDSVWLLLVGRIIAGLTAATHAAASAFVADISAPEERARNFGLIGAGFGFGFVAGPLIGGLLAGIDLRAPFWVACALATANLIFGALVLPETVTDAIRRPFDLRRANPLGALRAVAGLVQVRLLMGVLFVYAVAFHVYPVIWGFYGKAQFGWNAWMIGVSLALFGICMALVQSLAVGPAIKRLGERGTVTMGLLAEALTFLFYGLVTSGMAALAFTPMAAAGALVMPALQGMLSRRIPDDQQGELQGVLSSLNALAMIVSPLVMTALFDHFTRPNVTPHLPGAPFLLSGALMLVSLYLLRRVPRAS